MMCDTWKQFLILAYICISFLLLMPFICGQEISLSYGDQKVNIVRLIHRGNDTLAGHWPWHVAIFRTDVYQCGGSIIDQNTILTAAHCVHTYIGVVPVTHVSVHVGRSHLNKRNEHTKIYNASKIIIHHGYSDNNVNHDIALLKLTSNITMNNYVQPVCLWTMDSKQELIVSKIGTIVGFGYDEGDVVSDQLKQAAIEVMDPIICIQMDRYLLGPLITPDVFCGIGQTGVSACNGDSGGGMFFKEKGKWFLRGLVSYTPKRGNLTRGLCDPLKPTIFMDVAKYLEWIKQHIDQRVLCYESEFPIDYEAKLRLFNFQTCGIKSSTYTKYVFTWTQPWIGFVLHNNEENNCAITLISQWYAVGPAHCFENIGTDASVFFGGLLHDPNGSCHVNGGVKYCCHATQTRHIQNVIKHIQFDSIIHDIALIEFMTPVDTTQPNVQPICMPVARLLRTNATTNLHVASIDYRSSSVKSIPVRYMESVECMDALGKVKSNLKYNQLCAEEMNSGDKERCSTSFRGSPLHEIKVFNGTEQYFLRGFDLYGLPCEAKKPTIYLNAEPYIDWILYHMTVEGKNASGSSTLESEWSMLQQQPRKEKLSLFNMDTCGITSAVIQPDDHVPWIGIPFASSDFLLKRNSVILISEWYALAPKGMVQTKPSWNIILLGKRAEVEKGKPTYQRLKIKNIIYPHPDHPRQTFALIELLEPADLKNPYIRPICLPFMETLHHVNSTKIVLTTAEASETRIKLKSKNLTFVDHQTCQDKLVWTRDFLSDENSSCATEPLRGTQLLAYSGNPFQMHVQFGNKLRYFLYGMYVIGRNYSLRGYYGTYLFDKIELVDLEWTVENMKQKERPTTTSNERINLEPVQVPKSKENLFDFSSCGKSSTSYPAPWIGRFACTLESAPFTDPVTLISERYAVGSAILNDNCMKHFRLFTSIVIFGYPCYEEIKKESPTLKTNIIESCGVPTQWIAIKKILVHPNYNNSAIYVNDIALFRLAARANTSLPNVNPICLPIINGIRNYDTSSLVMFTTDNYRIKYNNTNVDNRYVNLIICQKLWINWKVNVTIDNSHHCVVNQRTSDEECDNIAPGIMLYSRQMFESGERYFLRGFAWEAKRHCSYYYPEIYTNTDAYLNWIFQTMKPKKKKSANNQTEFNKT